MIGADNGKKINTKPLISLKNFTGMGDNGMYWLDGFIPKSLQGQTILTQGWGNYSFIKSTDTGFTNLEQLTGVTSYKHIDNNQIAAINWQGIILDFNAYGTNKLGQIHQIPTAGSLFYCQVADILSTRKGNIIYSSSNHLGVGWVGKATGGSTTTLIDTTRNFVSLGLGTTAGINKIYNYTKGVEYTITSITTTTNINDTLNFAVGTAVAANDYYVAFCDTRFTFGTTSVNDQQFSTQPDPIYWNRGIKLWNDTYYILNGNYISSLSTDETTWTADLIGNQTLPSDKFKKQLPSNYQALMFETNQDRMLVGSYIQGKGALLLWDGYSSGWLSITETDYPISGMIRYQSGWVVLLGASLYYTDGYTLQYLNKLPDSIYLDNITPKKFNMISTQDGFILTFTGRLYSRLTAGTYFYNIKDNSWSFFPIKDKNNKFSQIPSNLFVINNYSNTFSDGTPKILASYASYSGTEIGVIENYAAKSSVLIYIKLSQKMNIGTVELNISSRTDYMQLPNQNNIVKVNYGEGKNNLLNYLQTASGTTTSSIVNGIPTSMKASVGQELFFPSEKCGYERSFITGITNPGVTGETLSISPSLSVVPDDGTNVKRFDLYSCGSKTINSNNFPQEIQFSIPTFYSDKLWLEIVFENQDVFPLDIHAINLF